MFLDRPTELPILKDAQSLLQKWLEDLNMSNPSAKAIADRLPSYFVYALNQEWRRNAKIYRPIIEALDTPFAKAGDRDWAWSAYSALLHRRINEGIFDEPFSLSQIYVPLNAFYLDEAEGEKQSEGMNRIGRKSRRVVVSLEKELELWLDNPNPQDAIRVISGGPGSGKSSFARIFAARHSRDSDLRVLYVPLHLIDPSRDLVEEIGRFVSEEGVLPQNPLDPRSPEPNLLIIFDGLDELASQGKAAAETARSFIREVDRTVEKRNNQQGIKLRVLISGREMVVQENESEFRRKRQIITLLPYFTPKPPGYQRHLALDVPYFTSKPSRDQGQLALDGVEYSDPENLLKRDIRQKWWKKYGVLTGKPYESLPCELDREDLAEITAQPLLNYLLALSFTRGKLDFTKDINLNLIYSDLIAAVHERGYDTHRYVHIRHMSLDEFFRVLEEIGLASWHGDGRTTTVREIQTHCSSSGLGPTLGKFREGAEEGVIRLLSAFFFRKSGWRFSGDATFVFTHKSFGEYLAARRIVRAVERVVRELEHRANNPDEGWDEKDALKHWAQICGPSAITPYIHGFLLDEMKLMTPEELAQWQGRLARLFSYTLQHGMPMEELRVGPFEKEMSQSRNAEEALLVVLNSCARFTKQVSQIEHVEKTAFGAWFRRIQGQRIGSESALVARCLSFLDLSGIVLDTSDLYNADLSFANLVGLHAKLACFSGANLEGANLRGADLERADLEGSNLRGANLEESNLVGANLEGAMLNKANLKRASLNRTNLEGANLEGVNLKGASLYRAELWID
jgi:uncharacterized protein YjbI with pentapeptide repeats